MAARGIILVSLLVACMAAQACHGSVLFSSLTGTLIVDASPTPGQVMKAVEDKITVKWALNGTYAGKDSAYKTVKVKLCYAPISQKDRGWRKTEDDLHKDKTCPVLIVTMPYSSSAPSQSFEWTVEKDVPRATYFIRAYVFDAKGNLVAYGQTTNREKTTNLFEVDAITGRLMSLDIASVCFSTFSILSLAGFFIAEKRRAKRSSPSIPQI